VDAGKPFDAVVVLGAAVWPGGVPSPSLRRRAVHGAKIVRDGVARVLIASGGVGRNPPSEASVIRTIAIAEGLSPDAIIVDEASTSTFETALNCSQILASKAWGSALIVTDIYHLPRCVMLFHLLGFDVLGSAPDNVGLGTVRWRWYYAWIREMAALPWSWIRMRGYLAKRARDAFRKGESK
jgi:uncharacterized SAM-binding protein YcdF (DUF218 family)